jgi:hypothetical protein
MPAFPQRVWRALRAAIAEGDEPKERQAVFLNLLRPT